jgi:hypothetical protein
MSGFLDALFAALQALILGLHYGSPKAMKLARSAATERFHSYRALTGDGHVALDGSGCDVLDSSESFSTQHGTVQDYVLTLFVVTPENRYFLFKANAVGKPYVKELPAARAKLVLKSKFREYAGAV